MEEGGQMPPFFFLGEDERVGGWVDVEGAVVHLQEAVLEVAADGVEGEVVRGESEGGFQFVGDCLEGHVGIGDEGDEEGHHPAEAVDEAEGKQEAIDIDGAMEEDTIRVGDEGAGDAFAAADDIGDLVEVVIEGALGDGVDVAAVFACLDPLAEFACEEDGLVAGGFDTDGEGGGKDAVEVGAGIGLAELVFQAIGQGDEVVDEEAGFFDVPGFISEREGLAGQGAGCIEEATPEAAAFGETVVAGGIAETEEESQGDAEEGEGSRVEVEVVSIKGFSEGGDEDRDGQQHNETGQELGDYRAAPDEEHAEPVFTFADDHALKVAISR